MQPVGLVYIKDGILWWIVSLKHRCALPLYLMCSYYLLVPSFFVVVYILLHFLTMCFWALQVPVRLMLCTLVPAHYIYHSVHRGHLRRHDVFITFPQWGFAWLPWLQMCAARCRCEMALPARHAGRVLRLASWCRCTVPGILWRQWASAWRCDIIARFPAPCDTGKPSFSLRQVCWRCCSCAAVSGGASLMAAPPHTSVRIGLKISGAYIKMMSFVFTTLCCAPEDDRTT